MPRNPKTKFKPLYRKGQQIVKQKAFSGAIETVTVLDNSKSLYKVRGERQAHLPAFGAPIRFVGQHELVLLERAAKPALREAA